MVAASAKFDLLKGLYSAGDITREVYDERVEELKFFKFNLK